MTLWQGQQNKQLEDLATLHKQMIHDVTSKTPAPSDREIQELRTTIDKQFNDMLKKQNDVTNKLVGMGGGNLPEAQRIIADATARHDQLMNESNVNYHQQTKPQTSTIKSPRVDDIVGEYTKRYKTEGTDQNKAWQKGFKDPVKNQDGSVTLTFGTKKEANAFMMDMAKANKPFLLSDAQGKVTGYSNGDGKLYHHDGKEFGANDTLSASNQSINDFQMPQPNAQARTLGTNPDLKAAPSTAGAPQIPQQTQTTQTTPARSGNGQTDEERDDEVFKPS